jgi:MFS family permease
MCVFCIAGLLSANTALVRASLSDISDSSSRRIVFAYFGATFALSRCIASGIGGLLIAIYPSSDWMSPYLFVCLVGAFLILVVLVIAFFVLPETLKDKKSQHDSVSEGLKLIIYTPILRRLFILISILHFANGALLLFLVLFLAESTSNHGIGFKPLAIGIVFMTYGLIGFLFQITFFKKLSRRFELVHLFRTGLSLLALSCILVPITYVWVGVVENVWILWTWIIFCAFVMSIGFMLGMPCATTMFTNASDWVRPSGQGLAQGAAQAGAAVARAMGPIMGGIGFAFATTYRHPEIAFALISLVYLAGISLTWSKYVKFASTLGHNRHPDVPPESEEVPDVDDEHKE